MHVRLSNLRSILSTATNGGEVAGSFARKLLRRSTCFKFVYFAQVLPLHDLLDMADLAAAVGGPSPTPSHLCLCSFSSFLKRAKRAEEGLSALLERMPYERI